MNRLAERVLLPLLRVHNAVYQGTNGLIGHPRPRHAEQPHPALDGRENRSAPHPHAVVLPRRRADYILVASRGGDIRSPDWYYNLKAHPDVEIQVGTKRFAVTARAVLPGDPDYDRLWQLANKGNANRYEAYQRRTPRPIPVVLSPRG